MSDTGGASILWTSPDPFAIAWRVLAARGDFNAAQHHAEQSGHPLASEAIDLLNRLRYEWSLSRESLVEKLKREMPSVTDAQLDAWTRGGELESLIVDGQLRYFRREPRNLVLHTINPRRDSTKNITPHLEELVKLSERSESPELMPLKTVVSYTLVVKPDRPGATKGSLVRCWLPFPQVYRQQRDVRLIDSFPRSERVAPKNAAQRTVYFEQKVRDPAKPVRFEVKFEYRTSAYVPRVWDRESAKAQATPASVRKSDVSSYLDARAPHVVFTDDVMSLARELKRDDADPLAIAKRIFDWVDDSIPWCAEHEYCLIPSIVDKALRTRRGDCGVQAITFITLARACGIPARWQSGWVTDPYGVGNMHDWAEAWIEPWGWVPIDVSYGKKDHADPRVRYFYFGAIDRYRLIVNTDYGQPLVPAKSSLRSEPLDFQRGEVEIDGRNLYFDEWDYEFEVERVDLPG